MQLKGVAIQRGGGGGETLQGSNQSACEAHHFKGVWGRFPSNILKKVELVGLQSYLTTEMKTRQKCLPPL